VAANRGAHRRQARILSARSGWGAFESRSMMLSPLPARSQPNRRHWRIGVASWETVWTGDHAKSFLLQPLLHDFQGKNPVSRRFTPDCHWIFVSQFDIM
jgi:hypothetical protein